MCTDCHTLCSLLLVLQHRLRGNAGTSPVTFAHVSSFFSSQSPWRVLCSVPSRQCPPPARSPFAHLTLFLVVSDREERFVCLPTSSIKVVSGAFSALLFPLLLSPVSPGLLGMSETHLYRMTECS